MCWPFYLESCAPPVFLTPFPLPTFSSSFLSSRQPSLNSRKWANCLPSVLPQHLPAILLCNKQHHLLNTYYIPIPVPSPSYLSLFILTSAQSTIIPILEVGNLRSMRLKSHNEQMAELGFDFRPPPRAHSRTPWFPHSGSTHRSIPSMV